MCSIRYPVSSPGGREFSIPIIDQHQTIPFHYHIKCLHITQVGRLQMLKIDRSTWHWSASEHNFECQSCQRWSSHMKNRIIFQWRTGAILLNGNEKSTPNVKVFWFSWLKFTTMQRTRIKSYASLKSCLRPHNRVLYNAWAFSWFLYTEVNFTPLWIFLTALVMFYSNQPSSRIMTKSKGYANNSDLGWGVVVFVGDFVSFCFSPLFSLHFKCHL